MNIETGYGAQGFWHAKEQSFYHGLCRFLAGEQGFVEIWNVAMWDGLLCFILVGLIITVTMPAKATWQNIRDQTSEVLKLKAKQKVRKVSTKDSKGRSESVKPGPAKRSLSNQEILDFIYGPNASFFQIAFATFCD